MRVTEFKPRRSLQASDQMADNRLGAIYFRQLEVGTVGQVGSNLGSRLEIVLTTSQIAPHLAHCPNRQLAKFDYILLNQRHPG